MKWIGRIVVLVLMLIVAAVLILSFTLGSAVKGSIESYGPELTGTSVHLASASLSPLTGSASVSECIVGNPEGYDSAFALRIGSGSASVKPLSLMGSPIHINTILIRNAEINYELALLKSNIGVIERNIKEAVGEGDSDMRVIIALFRLEDTQVHLVDAEETIELPLVELTDIGEKTNGATVAEATRQVVGPVMEAVMRVIANEQGTLERVKERGGNAVDKVKDIFR